MVRRVIADLQDGLDEPATFRELAARYYMSPYHFHRIFRAITGESPAEMTRRLRLERAAWEVRTTTDPIAEVAFRAGYATHEAFTKALEAISRRRRPTTVYGGRRHDLAREVLARV